MLKNIMKRPRFLIVGASGFIGSHLYARLGPERAVATYHRTPIAGGVYFDAGTMRISEILRDDDELTHAVLLHGYNKLDECARDPDGTGKVNVEGMQQMIDELTARNIKIVFTSSDAVFDGTRGAWTEDEPTHPVLTYGKQKVAIERYLAAKGGNWIVARLSKVVGADPGDHSLFGEWLRRIDIGEPIQCAHDLIMTPIDVDDVVTALIKLAEGRFSGIYNVCGPRSMTRLDLLNIFLAAVRQHRTVDVKVVACSIRDFPSLEARPLNQAMIPDKLFAALGERCGDMETVCRRIAEEIYGVSRRTQRVPVRS